MTNTDFAKYLIEKTIDIEFKNNDLSDLLDLRFNHIDEFRNWCNENKHAAPDDQLSSDIELLGKTLLFLIELDYLKD
jgi:hypothetical protein